MAFFHRLDDGFEFFALGLEDFVVEIDPGDGAVRRDNEDFEFVDVMELSRFGLSGSGHAAEFLIKAEVVLDRDRGVGLCFPLDGDAFFCLDRLVKAVGPAPTGHFPAGVFVHDHDAVVLDDVVNVFLVEGVGLHELGDGMHLLGLGRHLLL